MKADKNVTAKNNSLFPEASTAAKTIKAVVFDLGKVLVDFDHSIAAKKIAFFCDKSPKEIFDFFFASELTILFEEGKIAPLEFFLRIKEAINLNLSYEEFVPVWNEIFFLTEDNRAVYNLAKNLGNSYKVALLSNINILHFNYLKNNFPVFGPFHNILLSFELKSIKPSPLIYKKVLEILCLSAEQVFYTDDRPELVQESRLLGIRGFVFHGVKQLKKDLAVSGVRIN